MCAICTELFDAPAGLPCGHTFCLACIKSALRLKEECPVCRAKASKALPLAVNTILRKMIEDNDGPAHRAVKVRRVKTDAFVARIEALDPAGATAALCPEVDLTRVVGDAAQKRTPLLFACANAEGGDVDEWVALVKALLAAGADWRARYAEGRGALHLVAATGYALSITELMPALLDKGAREPEAVHKIVDGGWNVPNFDIYRERMDAVVTRMIEDASYAAVPLDVKRDTLRYCLRNGFDLAPTALFVSGVRPTDAPKMFFYAAAGGCAGFIGKLLDAGIVPIDTEFEHGQTALHIACLHGRSKVALLLLERGSLAFGNDLLLYTPRAYASRFPNAMSEVEKALAAKGATY